MKIVCNKSDLVKGVNIVSKAVPGKTTMPILECILIDATTDIIKLTANDMELGIQTEIAGEIIDRGMIAIDAKIFSEIVRKLPDNEVSIETDDRLQTTIVCEKSKFDISGKPGNEFAYLPIIEKDDSIVISQFTLKEVIRQTIFSIADTESNKLMTGELFEIKDNQAKITLSSEIYPLVVIQKTVSNYLENMYVKLEKEDKNILVNLFLKDNKENIKELVGNFYNELLAEALRYNIGIETKEIRELIVGRALYTTCIELDENIEEKIEDDMTSAKTFQREEYNLDDIAVNWFDKYEEIKEEK